MIIPHRQELLPGLDGDRVIGNDVEPLIVIAIAARRMVHRAGGVHFIIDHNLFQMHQPIVLVHENRNAGQTQRMERRTLFDVLSALQIGNQAHIDSPLLRRDHRLHRTGRGQPINRHIEVACRMPIERGQAIEWRVVWPVVDLYRRAPPGTDRNREHQHDETQRQYDVVGHDCSHRWRIAYTVIRVQTT